MRPGISSSQMPPSGALIGSICGAHDLLQQKKRTGLGPPPPAPLQSRKTSGKCRKSQIPCQELWSPFLKRRRILVPGLVRHPGYDDSIVASAASIPLEDLRTEYGGYSIPPETVSADWSCLPAAPTVLAQFEANLTKGLVDDKALRSHRSGGRVTQLRSRCHTEGRSAPCAGRGGSGIALADTAGTELPQG